MEAETYCGLIIMYKQIQKQTNLSLESREK